MDQRFLWGVAGLLSYVGAALALAMAVAPMFDAGGIPDIAPTGETVGLLVVSALLFGVGGLCLRRAANRVSPAGAAVGGSGGGTNVITETSDGDVLVRCDACGTHNEVFYSYCEGCAERL